MPKFSCHSNNSVVLIQLDNHDFFHCIMVTNEKQYQEKQLESLKLILSTDTAENQEKLKLMKLEQDAKDKQA